MISVSRAILAAVALLLPVCAAAQQQNDLREFRVGMAITELPESGYSGFACLDDAAKQLSDWRDYTGCPIASDGTRAISFHYDSAAMGEDTTRVAGQPVTLALLIGQNAQVTGLKIDTDPHARLYLHKKAYLFAQQVRARFGEEGWICRNADPTP